MPHDEDPGAPSVDVAVSLPGDGTRCGPDDYNQSLLRLYRNLGRATSYREILEALRPEILRMLGYKSVWFQLVRGDLDDLLLLDAGGPVEESAKALMNDARFHVRFHDEDFLIIPVRGDPFLMQIIEGKDVYVAEDAQTHPMTNKQIVAVTGNRTMVCLPLTLAERTLGAFSMGTFFDEGVRVPNEAQLDYLRALANHVAVAIDRVRFLGERRDAEEALRESEERYRRFVETSDEGVLASDEDGLITYASERMAELLACHTEDLIGRPVRDVVVDQDVPQFEGAMQHLSQGGSGTYEAPLRQADGSPVWLSLSATPILDESGTFRGCFAMATDISARKQAEFEREGLLRDLEEMLDGVVVALSATTSERDPYTAAHQSRVAQLALAIADRMGLDAEVVDGLRIAALLHDIGKIAVPAEILSKPTTLNDMEMGVVRVHSSVGYRLLEGVRFTRPVARIVLQHHERLDGSGYPNGLTGDEILLEAKILAVADVVEAMASHRPYRPALGVDAAIEEIRRGAGTLYDPDVVEACVDVLSEDPAFILQQHPLNR